MVGSQGVDKMDRGVPERADSPSAKPFHFVTQQAQVMLACNIISKFGSVLNAHNLPPSAIPPKTLSRNIATKQVCSTRRQSYKYTKPVAKAPRTDQYCTYASKEAVLVRTI
mmetsp:Transcript_2126/g.5635  ORF Transcript_2126/g.5635 Transcript_2126/m.5635 type:complete len:111 (+) Transcript_2126:1902-2234(+)